MRYIIDTQALVNYLWGRTHLPDEIKEFMDDYDNRGFVSVVTLHELVIKLAKKQIKIPKSISDTVLLLKDAGIGIIPVNHNHIIRLEKFERDNYHKDPFDRLLIAQCIEERMTFLTSDSKMHLYENYGLEYIHYELN